MLFHKQYEHNHGWTLNYLHVGRQVTIAEDNKKHLAKPVGTLTFQYFIGVDGSLVYWRNKMPELPNTLCKSGWMWPIEFIQKESAIARTFPRESKGQFRTKNDTYPKCGSGPLLHVVKLRSTYRGYGHVLIKSPWSQTKGQKGTGATCIQLTCVQVRLSKKRVENKLFSVTFVGNGVGGDFWALSRS